MADATTTTYGFTKPEVGASDATWGGKLNGNWDDVDDLLDGTTAIAPNLTFESWKVGGTAVTASAAELNKLDGVTGNLLSDAQSDTLTKGFSNTAHNEGTVTTGTFTIDPLDNNLQRCVNGGAFTLAPPSADCSVVILVTNNASAGAITTSGFTQVTGDEFTTTDGDDFMCFVAVINSLSVLNVVAMQ